MIFIEIVSKIFGKYIVYEYYTDNKFYKNIWKKF